MMSTPKPASEWTQDEIDTYLSELSYTHFQERLPLFIIVYSSCVAGVWGNSLTFVVYLNHFPHNSTRMFVLALSLTDFTTTLIGSPLSSMITVYFYSFYSDAACKAFFVIPTVLLTLSVLLLGLIAYDRYRHVCKSQSNQLSPHVALLLILVSCAVSLCSSFLLIPVYNLISIPTNVPGINGSHCMPTFQNINKIYATFFSVFSGIIFVGSLTLMIFCYGNIGILILCRVRFPRERPYTLSSEGPSALFSFSQSNEVENTPQTADSETSDSSPLPECTTAVVSDSNKDLTYKSDDINFKMKSGIEINNDKAPDSSKKPRLNILEISQKLLQPRKSTLQSSDIDREDEKELPDSSKRPRLNILKIFRKELSDSSKIPSPKILDISPKLPQQRKSTLQSSFVDSVDEKELPDSSKTPSQNILDISPKLPQQRKSTLQSSFVDSVDEKELPDSSKTPSQNILDISPKLSQPRKSTLQSSDIDREDEKELSDSSKRPRLNILKIFRKELSDSSKTPSPKIWDISPKLLRPRKSTLQSSFVDSVDEKELPDSSKTPSQNILDISPKLPQPRKSTLQSSFVDRVDEKELSSLNSSEGKTEVSPLQSPVFNTQVEQEPEKKINNIRDINSSTNLNQNALVAGTDVADTDVADTSTNEPNKTTVKIDSSESKTSLDDDVKQTESFSERVCPTASSVRRRSKHAGTTLMMFILTVLFVVFFLPFIIVSSTTPPDKIPCLGLSRVEMNLCEMAVFFFPVLNSVVNPFVYSMFSYRFRKESQRYLCWLRKS